MARNQIQRNFYVSDTYEPGSPSKIFTVATGLEEEVFRGSESFECTGCLHAGDHDIRCTTWRRGGHGWLNLQEFLVQFYNVAMMRIGAMTGREHFIKYQGIFGSGDKTGIDLPDEADTSELVYSADNTGPIDLATNTFGQNYNCTMVQLSTAFCFVLNGGSYYKPHVVKQILDERGSVVEKKEPALVRKTVSQPTPDFLKETMFQTVETGMGKATQVIGYNTGGETDTVERQSRNAKNYPIPFVGLTPIKDPQVFVYVIVDTSNYPPREQQAHSSYASAVFSKIMAEILPYLDILPTKDLPGNEALQKNLLSSEGINEPAAETGGAEKTGEIPAETEEQYKTDEYMPGGGGGEGASSDMPDAVPTTAGDRNRGGTGPKSLPAQAPPRRINESSGQAGPGQESNQVAEPFVAEKTVRQSE